MQERLPPACAFAFSVLAEHDLDPETVPEEAVEAALQHLTTCPRCKESPPVSLSLADVPVTPAITKSLTARKKKKIRRVAETPNDFHNSSSLSSLLDDTVPLIPEQESESASAPQAPKSSSGAGLPVPVTPPPKERAETINIQVNRPSSPCEQCRQLLPEYAEAMDSGQNVALLYPEVQEHLTVCESGCLVLLDIFRQEAKATRKYRRRPVRDPFSAIWWSLTGFFRLGQISMSPMALSYGMLILILAFASLSTYLGIDWYEKTYHPIPKPPHLIPTPDSVGFSDGLAIFDACNSASYRNKRDAAQAMQKKNASKADSLLNAAVSATQSDTTGCNGAEAAIYRADLQVRQSGRAYGVVVVNFDSGPGNADPQGGTDRHILYASYTQELVGAFIAQQQYNERQMLTPDAPLLYLVLANTTGSESGALQIANQIASMANASDLASFGLLSEGMHPLLGVLGLGPSSLAQIVLPVMCRAGVPLIAPTTTGLFIIDLITQTSLYRHCAPGFAFTRFSPDDSAQSLLGASYAYNQLHARNAVVFYDPSNPSSKGSAQAFMDKFSHFPHAHIVAQETAVASGLLDANGRPQASREDLLAGLNDAIKPSKPDLIFAPLLTNDVITLAQAIAQLPQNEQPALMIGGEFVQPSALQGLVQWARQQQLTLPHIYLTVSSAARPPTKEDWQKQFYASFCTSFATPGSYCSGAAALDQGALLFADGLQLISRAIGPLSGSDQFPARDVLVKNISKEQFEGVSCPIALHLTNNVLITSIKALPVILAIQQDGSIQIVG